MHLESMAAFRAQAVHFSFFRSVFFHKRSPFSGGKTDRQQRAGLS
jgi:hypothetical protein